MKESSFVTVPDLIDTVHPLYKETNFNLKNTINQLLKEKKAKKIILACFGNILFSIFLFIWCFSTNSIALTAYIYLTLFDLLSLSISLVSIWVTHQSISPLFPFGFERFEVLFVFGSTVLAQLGSFFIIKESFERLLEQPEIHTGRLFPGTLLALLLHLSIIYGLENPTLNHVINASSSSWMQEHVTEISESICHVIPGLSKLLLPRINPLSLISWAGALSIIIAHIFIDYYSYNSADTLAALWISLITCGTMLPMSIYTGKILLQTTPSHLIGQLDKCLREASTLDGVLEFKNEHFWAVSFGKLAGSVHVRVRRDADEQIVLAHVYQRLSNLIPLLNVQIFKDDWLRGHSFHSHQNPQLSNNPFPLMPLLPPPSFSVSYSSQFPSHPSSLHPLPSYNFSPLSSFSPQQFYNKNLKIPHSFLPSVEQLSDSNFEEIKINETNKKF